MPQHPYFPSQLPTDPADHLREFAYRQGTDPRHHFIMLVPTDWSAVFVNANPNPTKDAIARLASLRRSGPRAAEFDVFATHFPHEWHPADWGQLFLEQQGHAILASRQAPARAALDGEFLSSFDDQVYWTTITRDGPLIIGLQGRAKANVHDDSADEYLLMCRSWRQTSPSGELFAEPWLMHVVERPLACGLTLPVSWQFEEANHPPPGGSAFCLARRIEDQTLGHLFFAALPRDQADSPRGLLDRWIEQLRARGITAQEAPLVEHDPAKQFQGFWTATFPAATPEKAKVHVEAAVAEHPQAWFLLTMIGPDRSMAREASLANRRAFDMALDTFYLTPEGRA